jgi:hypothetical protein
VAARQQWFETDRVSIAKEHVKGWIVRGLGFTSRNPIGRCQLIASGKSHPQQCGAALGVEGPNA